MAIKSNSLILGKSRNGKAVFAKKPFAKGEEIIRFNGRRFTYKELPSPYNKVKDRYVQIGKNLYLGPSGSFDDFINHSCNPNSGLVINSKKAILYAIKPIKNFEEITWDYSTTMDEDDWEIDCNCGSKNCRERIRDFKWLPKKVQERYAKLGSVPSYLLKKYKKNQ